MNVAPFTLGGLPADELSQGMIRSLREIADEDGWTIEEVMTMAAEVLRGQTPNREGASSENC